MALSLTTPAKNTAPAGVFVDEVQEAWRRHCGNLRERDKAEFEKHACTTIQEYLEKLEKACQSYADTSRVTRIMEWFEPLYKAIELTTPAAAIAIQAYPNPGSLVLGGIVGLLSMTNRVIQYQKLSLRMLARMGRKAKIVLNYETEMFKDDVEVKAALFQVYSDILAFCNKAFRFLVKKNGGLHARVRGFRLLAVRDFESHFEKEIQDFEDHIDDLDKQACECFRRFVGAAAKRQQQYLEKLDHAMDSAQDHLQHQASMAELLAREQSMRQAQAERAQRQDDQKVLDWLSPLNLTAHYDRACEEHLPATGSWLLESEAYKSWKSRESSDILWVNGKPGCGKSILAAVVVMDLKSDPVLDAHTAYAFCRNEEETSGDPTVIMAALAKQLGYGISGLASKLENDHFKSNAPTHKRLQEIMTLFLTQLGKTYLVIDGLDESKDSDVLAKDLLALLRLRNKFQLKIIVFSRLDFNIDRHFESYAQLRVDLGANAEDLDAYIKHCFPDEPSPNVNNQIRSLCSKKAEGMFLWVKLLSQQLEKENLHSGHKLARVHRIPPGLDRLYDDILGTIWTMPEDVRSIAFLVLMWVMHARRPLTGPEMLEAVGDYSGAKKIKDVHKYPKPQRLVVLCLNLVYIDADGYFRLCHESVRDYLNAKCETAPILNQPLIEFHNIQRDVHTRLAEVCLNYLQLDDFVPALPNKTNWAIGRMAEEFPFLIYAARFWGDHASIGNADSLCLSITRLLDLAYRRELICAAYLYPSSGYNVVPALSVNSLHVLCLYNIDRIARLLPDVSLQSTVMDAKGRLPVEYAFREGHRGMCSWLLSDAPTLRSLFKYPRTRLRAIYKSASLGWSEVLQLLLSQDDPLVNTILPDRLGDTALTVACSSRNVASVVALRNSAADMNLVGENGYPPLHAAVLSEDVAIVDVLLQSGAHLDKRTSNGITALHFAAIKGNTTITQLLLERDEQSQLPSLVDNGGNTAFHSAAISDCDQIIKALHHVHSGINLANGYGDSPLHIAAHCASSQAAAMLLELGAHPDVKNTKGCTPLLDAVETESLKTLQVLLRGGCDATICDNDGRTALLRAASEGKTSMVECILENQPSERQNFLLNQKTATGEGAVYAAILNGKSDTAERLLGLGADASQLTDERNVPLHAAARHGNASIASHLLALTQNPNPVTIDGWTPLMLAAMTQRLDFIKQFYADCCRLRLSIDFDAQDKNGWTALVHAIRSSDENMTNFLLEKTSNFQLDVLKRSPIHWASSAGLDTTVQQLLAKGVPTEKDLEGDTPLHFASVFGHLSVAKVLVNTSLTSINETNKFSCTPLFNAMSHKHFDVAKVLLDAGADPLGASPPSGRTLLHLAAAAGEVQMARRILAQNVDLEGKDVRGETALHYATQENQLEMVKFLLTSGSDINAVDSREGTCILYAARYGDLAIIQELARHRTLFNATDECGQNAACYAAFHGHDRALELLRANGVDLSLESNSGSSPLSMAIKTGQLTAVKCLLKSQVMDVNERFGDGRLPVAYAARQRHVRILRELLQAQADPNLRDRFGYSAFDYAKSHLASVRELLKHPGFWDGNVVNFKPTLLSGAIKALCERMLLFAPEISDADLIRRVFLLSDLAEALRYAEDTKTAILCYAEILSHVDHSRSDYFAECELCLTPALKEGPFVCSSCPRTTYLCEQCFQDYQDAGRRAPLAVRELQDWQYTVGKVRLILTDHLNLIEMNRVCGFLDSDFIGPLCDRFEHWKRRFNTTNKYQKMMNKYGNLEFFGILLQALKLWPQDTTELLEPLNSTEWSKLEHRYSALQQNSNASQEFLRFHCEHHTYCRIPVSDEGVNEANSRFMDKDTGTLTASFFEALVHKYGGVDDQRLATAAVHHKSAVAAQHTHTASSSSFASHARTTLQRVRMSRSVSFSAGELNAHCDAWDSEPGGTIAVETAGKRSESGKPCARQRPRSSSMALLGQTGDWQESLAREADDMIAAQESAVETDPTFAGPSIPEDPPPEWRFQTFDSGSDAISDEELFSMSKTVLQYERRKPVADHLIKAHVISLKIRALYQPRSLIRFQRYCRGIREVEAERSHAEAVGMIEPMETVTVDTDTDSESDSDGDDS